ncbi:MAG: aminotransferase class V-fold PLP-dependent enzyme [Hyphomicrobium zavarzinii]|jgi:alanine-glyoxylate transaminase/serine-glyoxylate transaminase/serine-pyruvate transaminase|uniref:pyridoxal-phosphate-dependent aminotransferase family protein n=1 Tax=Hyphomicrobium TaxID=81 RepID=UPI00035D4965|nr:MULTISPECIES: aminotransferase class V-fold PLP-dependent enzyme [Hyphomicrobium]MBL8845567.1 aminotransferase class V-fold PLP-dependent enzyme [Hyphomicrobium zavarzinii]WBT38908.1 aminotransferase class V-fold PLP-dependent enzyme [Hyphomicrobium sp. DMF-1]HML42441.1 aminotransferase class V-fold PLP-dependent enzyme [Hyphomicrobium zavarzinii]
MSNEPRRPGRHFLQIPGPTPIPERIIAAMARQILDHRGPEFQKLGKRVLSGVKTLFKTQGHVIIYPSSGTGAWEAALTNTLSPGDRVLMVETGQFAVLWKQMVDRLGLRAEVIQTDWRIGADANEIEAHLRKDKAKTIKAVCVVHNETSTGCRTRLDEVRRAIDAADHPALLMTDSISGLAAADLRHDEWGIDVTVSGSQKGMMMPPGLSFTAISDKAIAASKTAKLARSYFSWDDMLAFNGDGYFPYTPATGLLYGLDESIKLIHEEGLENVLARHERLAEATRIAVRTWGLEVNCRDEKYDSPAVTTVLMPDGHNADAFRKLVLESFNMSLGTGLNKLAGKAFRIAHLGDTNELTVLGALTGVEMGLELAGVPHKKGGVQAAMAYIADSARPLAKAA